MAFLTYIAATMIFMIAIAISKVEIEIDNTTRIIIAILSAAEAIRIELKK